MNVELDRTIPLPASADVAWQVLGDIEAVAGCMPGAKITERIDDRHYKGTVAMRLGPASMTFRGEIEVRAIDATERTLQLVGKGTDTTGTSSASMDLTASIEAGDASSSTLRGHSVVSVGGKAAVFGGRMMNAVADQILNQFVGNFVARVAAVAAPPPPPPPAPNPEAAAPSIDAGPIAPGAQAASAPPPHKEEPATAVQPLQQKELDGLALLWSVIKAWWRGLFSKSRP